MSATPLKHPLLLACCLAILSAAGPALAAPGDGANGNLAGRNSRREAMQRQRAQAISQLSAQQRQAFFSQVEQMEADRSRDRMQQIGTLKTCMVQARNLSEVQSCQNALQESRSLAMQQRRSSMRALRERFGMPTRERNPQQRLQPGIQGL